MRGATAVLERPGCVTWETVTPEPIGTEKVLVSHTAVSARHGARTCSDGQGLSTVVVEAVSSASWSRCASACASWMALSVHTVLMSLQISSSTPPRLPERSRSSSRRSRDER